MIKSMELEEAVIQVQDIENITEESYMIRDIVLSKMGELRRCLRQRRNYNSKEILAISDL